MTFEETELYSGEMNAMGKINSSVFQELSCIQSLSGDPGDPAFVYLLPEIA